MRICYVLTQTTNNIIQIIHVYRHDLQAYKDRMALQERAVEDKTGDKFKIHEVELK